MPSEDWLSEAELQRMGFAALGRDVRISRGAAIYNSQLIAIGDRSRIDTFAVLSTVGGVAIGSDVHISAHVTISGRERVTLGDFVALSVRASILTASDDFAGGGLHGPSVPDSLRRLHSAPVTIGPFALVGAGCVVMPGVTIGDGASVGALSLVKDDVPPDAVVAGVPAHFLRQRDQAYRALAAEYLATLDESADPARPAGAAHRRRPTR